MAVSHQAGSGTAVVAVPDGSALDGYGARTAPSSGRLRPLEANALVLEVGSTRFLLVSIDAVAIDGELVDVVRRAANEEFGIGADQVLVAASHTHAGPAGLRARAQGRLAPTGAEQAVRAGYVEAMLTAARRATDSTRGARLTVCSGVPRGVAAHRRDPEQSIDATATLLSVLDDDGRDLALVWHYACHATVLGPDNTLLSPDLPGDVRQLLRDRTGAGMPVLYLPGAGGDVSTRFTRRAQTPAELARLARAVVDAWTEPPRPLHLAQPHSWRDTLALTAPLDDPADIRRRLHHAQDELIAAPPEPGRRVLETTADGLRRRLDRAGQGAPATVDVELQAIALGDLALAALPGEPVSALGSAIRAVSSHAVTLPVGYANGYVGYLPDAGTTTGYEAAMALVTPGSTSAAVDWFAARLSAEAQRSEAQRSEAQR